MMGMHSGLYPKRLHLLLMAVLLVITMITASGCQADKVEETPETEGGVNHSDSDLVSSANDGWRYYSFNPGTIRTWVDDEGNEIVDVMVTVDYKDNPGTSPREDQQWHIDKSLRRYRVSDSIAYDLEGNICET